MHKIPGMLMLIDFEKAFDSISGHFLYNVLSFFGFDNKFIKWIKLFNNNINAYVLQCGKLSDPIQIGRGCRQGDPISAYLFILAAEILKLLVENDSSIQGVKIGKSHFKIAQFADDTTLFLDGSRCSLQAVLNLLEIFGSYSGLKMNTEKTKVIWIGCKRHSKDKLKVNVRLAWDEINFTLLGVKFSTNLEEMPEINYRNSILQINKIFNNWKSRKLTPIGRITVIKSLALPKFNHIFASVPCNQKLLNEINKTFFSYLWNGKPDKIKRNLVTKPYKSGGLNMVNVFHFEMAQKLSWIKRIVNSDDHAWCPILAAKHPKILNVITLGGEWLSSIKKETNPFWKTVFQYWTHFCRNRKVACSQDILNSCLWYNSHISKDMFYPNWYQKGILTVGDVVESDGKLLPVSVLRHRFNLNINLLNYYTVRSNVSAFIKKYKNCTLTCKLLQVRPCLPFHANILFGTKTKSNSFYRSLIQAEHQREFPTHVMKWNSLLNDLIDNDNWNIYYKVCFWTIKDNSLTWFQYRVLFRILGTRSYLYKIKIADSNLCGLCGSENETIVHIFTECSNVKELWINIVSWIENKLSVKFELDTATKL